MEPESLQKVFDSAFAGISQVREAFTPQLRPREVGTISSVATGIAKVSGLPGVGFDELVRFPGDVLGIAFNVDEDEVGVVLLGEYWHLHAGDEVERTGRVMDVTVGEGLLGRVIDPLGRALDGNGPVASSERLPIERPAPPIMDRAPVTVPLQTGLKVLDALIPIGRGQRELILGDRQTGKTAIAIDTILNQRDKDVLCVYCAIGQRASAIAKAVATFRQKDAMAYTVVVVTEGNDPPGLAYIAPYAATSIAEHFMEQGRDVLIVYDDLTHHARAYRELSLLLRRPPGREAFPGDIFYIHSRLLERATHLCQERGGGSLTALPIIETEAQNISAYIPTNLISITDGQVYLSPSLFELGVLPAVDVGKSVSRVGGKAQWAAYRAVAGDLKLAYAQFEELETFARFGARLDEDTRKIVEHGRRIRACLKQSEFAPVSVPAQIAVLLALTAELFDPVPIDQMTEAEHAVREAAADIPAEVSERLGTVDKLSDEDRQTIIQIARKSLAPFQRSPEPESEPEDANGGQTEVQGDNQGEVMSDTTASLRRKINNAGDLQSVVRTMKALAASSIGQYEQSVRALGDYYRTVELGLGVCFRGTGSAALMTGATRQTAAGAIGAVVFGSDQGLVGQFNDVVADYAIKTLAALPAKPEVWAVGERVHARLADAGLPLMGLFTVPNSVKAITPLVGQILVESDARRRQGEVTALHLFYNRPTSGPVYAPVSQRLLPLDETWRRKLAELPWPTGSLPEVMGGGTSTLRALIREYLFVSLFRACAESLASENASRLAAMQRADKNIDELLEDLNGTFHRLRQSGIDEELFDVISGFEALSGPR